MKPLVALGLIALLGLAAAPSCGNTECTVDSRNPDEPVVALECASDRVCYRGACVTGCRAGREEVDTCSDNSDCSSARPNCLDGYCSACQSGTVCVPGINVCQSVYQIPLPPAPDAEVSSLPVPPGPRDAGTLEPGLVVTRDAEVIDITDPTPVSHTLFVDIARVESAAAGTHQDSVEVLGYSVEGNEAGLDWRIDQDRPVLQEPVSVEDDCEVTRFLDPAVAANPFGLDDVRIDNTNVQDPGDAGVARRALDLSQGIVATFDTSLQRYTLSPSPLPDPLLSLSELFTRDSVYVSVTGSGSALTARSWPNPETDLHVPFELSLGSDTAALLAAPIAVGSPPSVDIRFTWARVGTGVVANERIVVRIPGSGGELRCVQNEGPNTPGSIRVSAGLLEDFVDTFGIGPGTRLPLFVERATEQQLQVDPGRGSRVDGGIALEYRHLVVVRVRHSFQGEIQL